MARFAKEGKLTLERNSIKVRWGGEFCVWFTNNAHIKDHFHNDQRNLPRAA